MIHISRSDGRKQIGSMMATMLAALLAALVIPISPGGSAHEVEDCIEAPSSPPPQGSHWYYRTDRVKQRKCWYLGPEGKRIQNAAPHVQQTASSRAPVEAETAGDRLEPALQPETQTTATWRATTVRETIQEDASAVRWPHPPQLTGVMEHGGAAMSSPALQEHASMAAQEIDAEEKTQAHAPLAAGLETPGSELVAPLSLLLRVLLVVGGALALAGILLNAVFNIAFARRRRVIVDQSGADWRISAAEQVPPTFGSRLAHPRPLVEHDTDRAFEEMLREMLRTRERQAA
jgi:hypothetical protein